MLITNKQIKLKHTDSNGWCRVHNLFFSRFASLVIDVDGQRREDQQELLAADLDSSQGIQRMVGYEGNARMFSLNERHWMLVAH